MVLVKVDKERLEQMIEEQRLEYVDSSVNDAYTTGRFHGMRAIFDEIFGTCE